MKSFFIPLLLCFTFLSAFSQNYEILKGDRELILSNTDLIDHVRGYTSNGLEYKYSFTYNSTGKCATILKELFQNELYEPMTRGAYTYDANANMLTSLTEIYANGIWSNTSKGNMTYDSNGRMTTSLTEQWLNDEWKNYSQNTFTYNSVGKILTSRFNFYQSGEFTGYAQNTYTYDVNGKQLSFKYENWLKDKLRTCFRYNYTYDLNGNTVMTITEDLDTTGQLVNKYRTSSNYDSNGYQISDIYDEWKNNQWSAYMRYSYTNDSAGNQILVLSENCDSLGLWSNYTRGTMTYDVKNNLLTNFNEQWLTDKWVNYYRETYTYNSNNDGTSYLYEKWQNEQWVNSEKTTISFDSIGNRIGYQYESWNAGKLVDGCKRYTYTFNPSRNFRSQMYETTLNEVWSQTNNNWSFLDSNKNSYGFNGLYKIELTYQSEVSIPEEKTELSPIVCFPNPTTNFICLPDIILKNNAKLSIVSSTGAIVYRCEPSTRLNISFLPPGVYFLKSGGKTVKFVKE